MPGRNYEAIVGKDALAIAGSHQWVQVCRQLPVGQVCSKATGMYVLLVEVIKFY